MAIVISRTDSIGDVVLTIPLAHVLKEKFPTIRIIFLGNSYTKPILDCCQNVDEIVCWDEISKLDWSALRNVFKAWKAECIIHVFPNKQIANLAKEVDIPMRIGTSHRYFHWYTCNKLPNFSRKNSDLHEAQLNFKLLEPLSIHTNYSLQEIQSCFDLTKIKPLDSKWKNYTDKNKYNLILHPKSKGSAQEWHVNNFSKLIQLLPKERFRIFITGTTQEGRLIKSFIDENPDAFDMTGKMDLSELLSFINHCDGMVAASTGPLHLAAALGKTAVGIYSSLRPIHPGRWAPVGTNAFALVASKTCVNCKNGKPCDCLSSVKPEEVAAKFMSSLK